MNTVRVSLPDKDLSRGKPDEMAIDNRYANPKIDTQAAPPHAGNIFLNWTSTTGISQGTTKLIYRFEHGYNYVPTAFASCKFDNGANVIRGTLPFLNGSLGVITLDCDQTYVNLKYFSIDSSTTPSAILPFLMQIRFYVFAERGYE